MDLPCNHASERAIYTARGNFEFCGTYEIIESYPKDKYMPSYLVYATHNDEVLHIQIAADRKDDSVRIVTAYKPTLDKWEAGFKIRRKE